MLEVVKCFQEVVGHEIQYEVVERREGDVAECFAAIDKVGRLDREILKFPNRLERSLASTQTRHS